MDQDFPMREEQQELMTQTRPTGPARWRAMRDDAAAGQSTPDSDTILDLPGLGMIRPSLRGNNPNKRGSSKCFLDEVRHRPGSTGSSVDKSHNTCLSKTLGK